MSKQTTYKRVADSNFKEKEKNLSDLLVNVWSTEKVEKLFEKIEGGEKIDKSPFWEGDPDFRAANIVFEYTEEELSILKRCAEDVSYFATFCHVMTDDGVMPIKLRDYQEDVLRDYSNNRQCVFLAPRQSGKAQPLDAKVWGTEGVIRFGDLRPGSKIFGADGNLTTVLGVFPQGIKDIFEITFADGSKVRSCKEHLWTVQDVEGKSTTLQLQDMMSKGILTTRGDYKWFVKTAEPVAFGEKSFNVDPYLLGLMIGDGCMANRYINLATTEPSIVSYLEDEVCEKFDAHLSFYQTCEYRIIKNKGHKNLLTQELKSLGLMGCKSENKFIPTEYLYGSIEQRLSLLQGLMDTDGCVSNANDNCSIEFSTASERLADDFQQLCESLGIVIRRTTKESSYKKDGIKIECKIAHRIKLQLPNDYPYPIFRLKRKQSKIRNKKYDWGYRRGIASVKLVSTEEAQCIMVDNKDSLYLTDHFIPTHNTIATSIFLAHYLIFNTDRNLMILANVGTTTEELIDKIKVILRHLPFFMKPGMVVNNVMTMKFDNGCRLFGRTTTKNSGIGFTVHFLYIDEFAHIHPSFLDKLWRALYPTLSSSKISRIIITSTPNGTNKFYEIYKAALAGENEFCPMRIYWWQVPGRDEEWKRKEIANLGSEEDFNQEYECDFLTSTQKLIDVKTLLRMNSMSVNYKWHEIESIEDIIAGTEIRYNHLKWHPKFSFENISDDDRFVISVDTAGGGGGRADYTVFNIFKLIPMPINQILQKTTYLDESDFFSLMQIGLFRDNSQPIEDVQPILEQLIYKVFGVDKIRVVLEMDFKGALLYEKMSKHKDFFEDLFIHTKHSENAKILKPGLKLNPKNKDEFCLETRQLIKSGRVIITEKLSTKELSDFGKGEKGGYKSQTGHDDIAMTCVNLAPYFRSSQYYEHVEEVIMTCNEKYKNAIAERMKRGGDDTDSDNESYGFLKDLL